MLISIIIPSRDRAVYLKYSVQTALNIQDKNIEIIISDNASTDHTREIIRRIDDTRLKYFNTNKRISMRANFENALKASSGDYVIFFGDDDGIIPQQFKFIRNILEKHKPDALSWDFLTYTWPIKDYAKKSGSLRFEHRKIYGNVIKSTKKIYLETLLNAELGRHNYLPRIYHGCMSRKFLDKLVNEDGLYFCSRSPDLHMSFRAAQYGGNFLRINHPFTINGISPASTGGGSRSTDKNNKALSKSFEYIAETEIDPIKDVLPLTKSMGFSFLSALETLKHHFPNPPLQVNYNKWYAFCLSTIPKGDTKTATEIINCVSLHAKKTSTERELNSINPGYIYIKYKFLRLISKIKHYPFSFRVFAQLNMQNNILSAAKAADIVLKQDLKDIIEEKTSHKSSVKNAKKRGKRLNKQMITNQLVYFEN